VVNVKIIKLNLTNYRGAQSLSLELNPKVNVFIGVNGSGKSTVLDATGIMLSWIINRIIRSGAQGKSIDENDITNGKTATTINLFCETEEKNFESVLSKTRKGHLAIGKSNFQDLNEYTKIIQSKITETNEEVNLPLLVYYPVNRVVLDIPLRIREKHNFNLLSAFDGALTSAANFRTFFEWFRAREDLENETRIILEDASGNLQVIKNALQNSKLLEDLSKKIPLKQNESNVKVYDSLFPDPQLTAVRTALREFLPEFSNLTVRRNPLRMEVIKNGKPLIVNQLSDGEKSLIALIGDLARRMAIANPISSNPLNGYGIVLIDEIDLHLHPKWQRMIIPKLIKVFPNCQFIISTHSPSVITHVHPDSLFCLEQNDIGIVSKRPYESYGKTVERILEDLMGLETTRPDEISSSLTTLFKTIDSGDLNEAKDIVSRLKEIIGTDPELAKADVLIRRKELVGK
jgi:predicted ATP-binding protein involved in virulence